MNGITASLLTAGGALQAYGRALEVTQNNVVNASTPGYARQSLSLSALPFDPSAGLPGGVRAGDLVSARSDYADQTVRRHASLLGLAQQQAESLSQLQSVFDISGESGLPYALNGLYEAFSAWGQSAEDPIARANVIERAEDVAAAFRQTSSELNRVARNAQAQLRDAIESVNQLAARLAGYNRLAGASGGKDAGLDAQINAALESLSEYVDVTAVRQGDGTLTVLMEGQVPLVAGAQQYEIGLEMYESAEGRPAQARIVSGERDITARITGGKLGALIEFRNATVASYIGDSEQQGSINRMARQFADRVNAILTSGYVSGEADAASGAPLFTYGDAGDTAVAARLSLDESASAAALGAFAQGPPLVSNGIPLQLASLASPTSAEDQMDGASFTGYYGRMAAQAGYDLRDAQDRQQLQESAVAQAKDLRQQMSGVSLDQEAIEMVEFQRAYQAVSRLIGVLDQLTEETINMLRI